MKSRILPIAHKEFIQILRDPRTLGMTLFMPVLMLLLYGYAITFDIKHVGLAVYDLDKGRCARDFIYNLSGSEYFDIRQYCLNDDDIPKLLDAGQITAGIIIPQDFSKRINLGQKADLQILVDGTEPNTANVSIGYLQGLIKAYSQEHQSGQIGQIDTPIDYRPQVWYNPELKSVNFIVPGLIVILLMLTCTMLTTISVVREREKGTMEMLIAAPIRAYELMLGKILPYVAVSFCNVIMVILVGNLWFKVPLKGSIILLFGLTFLFLLFCLGLGLFVSTIARTQQVATLLSGLLCFLPSFLLSGFIFPIKSMPEVIQGITYLVPARYFLEILRGIFLKGVGTSILWKDALLLFFFGVAMIVISCLRFKKRLE
ncbi:MAG: ABC transporter permease [Candidatus Omnitrophica bacterium]|nr:ABC transporter permease [Candidatus Omnitrophota bacterium]